MTGGNHQNYHAMKKLLIASACAMMALVAVCQRTTRRALKVDPESAVAVMESVAKVPLDTLAHPDASMVEINGYDKPLRSRRETFFVTNNSKRHIAAMAYTITYYDNQHRMLHRASHNIDIDIPSWQTRQANMRSWDAQQAFYYKRSAVPDRTKKATPYEVTISVDTLFCK